MSETMPSMEKRRANWLRLRRYFMRHRISPAEATLAMTDLLAFIAAECEPSAEGIENTLDMIDGSIRKKAHALLNDCQDIFGGDRLQ